MAHKPTLDQYECHYDGCEKTFKKSSKLEVHLRTHTGERPFVCPFSGCNKAYIRSQHLSRHVQRVHTPGFKDDLKLNCPCCEQELANRCVLKRHIKTHHGIPADKKVYKCMEEGCEESFHKKKQLSLHRLEHSKIEVTVNNFYRCPHEGCGKTFVYPTKLKRHMKVHQGYSCDSEGCEKTFPNWSSLRKHKAVDHAPVFSCHVCQAVFSRKPNLTQHIKIHATNREPLTCPRDNCNRIFFYKKNLNQHIREYHENEDIWKSRDKRKIGPHNKRKLPVKKSIAARLCGLDDRTKVKFAANMKEKSRTMKSSTEPVSRTGEPVSFTSASSLPSPTWTSSQTHISPELRAPPPDTVSDTCDETITSDSCVINQTKFRTEDQQDHSIHSVSVHSLVENSCDNSVWDIPSCDMTDENSLPGTKTALVAKEQKDSLENSQKKFKGKTSEIVIIVEHQDKPPEEILLSVVSR